MKREYSQIQESGWKRKTAFVDKIIHDIEKGGRKFLCCKNSEWKEANQHAKGDLIKGLLRVTPEEIAASIIQRSIRKKIAMKREQGPQKVEPLLVSATRSTGGDVAENKSIMLDSDEDKSSIADTAKYSKQIDPVILNEKEIIELGSEEEKSSVEDTSKPAHQIEPLLLTATRRVTRSQSKMGGNTTESAISLDVDDENSIENFGFDSAQLFEEDEDGDEGAPEGSFDDLEGIEVVRIALGKEVFRSNCSLKFELSTHEGFLLVVFLSGGSTFKVKVDLNGDTLKEMAYYCENDDDDETSISILALCVQPTQDNKLNRFEKNYDGKNGDKKFIILEVRDKHELQVRITVQQRKVSIVQPHLFSCPLNSHIKNFLNKMEESNYLKSCARQELEFYELNPYVTALVKDDERERKRRLSTKTSTSNKVLVVYPFKIEEEILNAIPAELRALSDVIFSMQESGTSKRDHYLTITESDKSRLEPGQFLNDTLVDFWMS